MIKGQVKWFDAAKGFGFVVCDDEEGDILLHANVLRNFGRSSVAEGSRIVIDVQVTDRGRQASLIHEIDAPISDIAIPESEDTPSIPEIADDIPFQPARVKWFDKAKGFGFANIFGSDDDIFSMWKSCVIMGCLICNLVKLYRCELSRGHGVKWLAKFNHGIM